MVELIAGAAAEDRAYRPAAWDRVPTSASLRSAATIVTTPVRSAIRSVVSGARVRPVFVYASRKAGCGQPCESLGEVALVHICEADTAVVDFQTQPHRLVLTQGRRPIVYIPDLARDLADGSVEIIEVKDRYIVGDDPAYDWKLAAAAEIYRGLGFSFRLMRRSDVFQPSVRVTNAQIVQLSRHTAYDDRDVFRALSCVHANSGIATLGEVEEALGGGPRALAVARALMVARIIAIDLDQLLCPESEVRQVEAAPGVGRRTFKLW